VGVGGAGESKVAGAGGVDFFSGGGELLACAMRGLRFAGFDGGSTGAGPPAVLCPFAVSEPPPVAGGGDVFAARGGAVEARLGRGGFSAGGREPFAASWVRIASPGFRKPQWGQVT